jgi:hypothetical protein
MLLSTHRFSKRSCSLGFPAKSPLPRCNLNSYDNKNNVRTLQIKQNSSISFVFTYITQLLLLLFLLSPLCMIFTIIYLKQTMFLRYMYNVAAVLYLQFVLHVMIFRPRNMFCTFTLALFEVCMQCPIRFFILFIYFFFCSSIISCLPAMLLRYWASYF